MGRAWLPAAFGVAMLASCGAESPRAGTTAPPPMDAGRHVHPAADLAAVVRSTAHAYRWNAGMLAGGGSTFESRVSDRGVVEIVPRTSARSAGPPFAPSRGAPMKLETAYVARGARMLASGPAPATVEADGSVAIRRGAITERLENDDTSVEQSWRFEHAPEGEGDLVVVVRAAGQRFSASTDHGLHFTDGALGLRYGAATWIDADGHRTPVTPRFAGGEIAMTIPSSVLASSRFPAVLDPTVSTETEIDKPAMGSTQSAGGEQYNPAIVSAGPNKGYVAVWFDYRGVRPAIYAARIDTSGNVVDATGIPVATGVGNAAPSIAATANGFLVTWAVSYVDIYEGPGVYGVRLDAQAQPLDAAPIAIAPNTTNVYQTQAASDGASWFVVWQQYTGGMTGYDVAGAIIPGSGAVTTPAIVPIAHTTDFEYNPQISYDGSEYFVAWRSYSSVSAQIFGKDGKPVGMPTVIGGLPSVYNYSTAFDGTNHLVVWSQYTGAATQNDIYARRMNKAASLVDASNLTVIADNNYDDTPQVAFDGTDYLIGWNRNGTLMAARMQPNGTMRDAPTTIATGQYYSFSLATDTAASLALDVEYTAGLAGDDVKGVRIPKTPAAATQFVVSRAAPSETSPAVAFNGKNHYVAWLDARGPSVGIYGATLGNDASPGALTKLVQDATKYPSVQRPHVASDGTGWLVVFYASEPSASRQGIYGLRIDASGNPDATGAFPIWSPSTTMPPYELDTEPDAAFDGTNYLVVWQSQTSDGNGIGGIRLPKTGNTPVDAQPLRISTANPIERRIEPSIAFDGTNYFVGWITTHPTAGSIEVSHIAGTRVSKQGTPIDGEIVVCNAFLLQRAPAVAADTKNGGFMLAWEDYRTDLEAADIYGARVSAMGQTLDGQTGFKIAAGAYDESRPRVAPSGDGTNWVVAWRDLRSKTTYDIYGAWVSLAGRTHDPDGYLLSADPGDEDLPWLDSTGAGKLVLAYQRLDPANGYGSYRIRARSIDSGALVGSTCAKNDDCASRSCVDGYCCSTECDGCGVCNQTPGTCTPRPAGDVSPTCPAYKCKGDLACPTQCTTDSDCAQNASCDPATHTCISRIICTDDHTLKDLSGNLKDCAPYKCLGDACKTQCGSVDDCATGFVCTPDGRCVQSPATPDAGGCAASGSSPGSGALAFGLAWLFASVVRRRRRRVV